LTGPCCPDRADRDGVGPRGYGSIVERPAVANLSAVESERLDLGAGAWVDIVRGWVADPDEAYRALVANVAWQQGRVFRYERWIDEPRLGGAWSPSRPPPHPVVLEAHHALQQRYRVRFDGCGLAWYRDGRDSVAFHRDRDLRWLDDTVIALVTLGQRRPWYLRPRSARYDHDTPNKGASHDLSPGPGDLIVMGGRTQTAWEHSVPKTDPRVGGRISLQWRWTSRQGPQELGGSYRKPVHFSR